MRLMDYDFIAAIDLHGLWWVRLERIIYTLFLNVQRIKCGMLVVNKICSQGYLLEFKASGK